MITSIRRLRARPCCVSLLAIGCVSPYPTALTRDAATPSVPVRYAPIASARRRDRVQVGFVVAIRVGVPLDDDLRAREHVGGLLHLFQKVEVRRQHGRLAAREREPDQSDDHAVALALHARLVALEHVLDRRELLAQTRLGLDALHERGAFLRHAAELLVEVADLVLEIADPLARVGRVCLRLRGPLAQLLDVRDEIGADRLDALVELHDFVRGSTDLNYGVFVGQDHVLDRAILLSHRADHLREIDRVPRFVVRLLREASRQVGVVAVLIERPLGLREEGSRALVGLRREARYAALVRFG